MIRKTLSAAARGAVLAFTRGTLAKVDDSKKLQEVDVKTLFDEGFSAVENWLSYGFTHVPVAPNKDGAAEALIGFLGGARSHLVVLGIIDRRFRLKNLKEGDVAQHDHRQQQLVLHKDGITKQSPMTITTQVVDDKGKVLSTIVQEKGGQKVTMTTKDGASVVLDGPNITKTPGPGGKIKLNGAVDVAGTLTGAGGIVAQTLAGLAGVTSGGQPVKTS